MARGSDVGGQHALLDDPVCIMPLQWHDRLQPSLLIETETRLHGIEIDRATFGARLVQQLVQAVKVVQVGKNAGMLGTQLGITIAQHGADLVIGQACVRIHYRLEETRTEQLTLGIEI